MTHKICSKCNILLPLSEYYRVTNTLDGYSGHCRGCWNTRKRAWKQTTSGRESVRKSKIQYKSAHPDKYKAETRRSAKKTAIKKYRTDPKFKISLCIATNMRQSLAKGSKAGRKWESLVGYSVGELITYLEKRFLPGMTWQNYGKEWHIDHIYPISAHNYTSPEDIDFKRCWSLKNLRPLWKDDNVRKGASLHKPFQPALIASIKRSHGCADIPGAPIARDSGVMDNTLSFTAQTQEPCSDYPAAMADVRDR